MMVDKKEECGSNSKTRAKALLEMNICDYSHVIRAI